MLINVTFLLYMYVVPATDLVAFGGINYLIFRPANYLVHSLVNNTVSVCSLFGVATSGPVEVRNDRTVRLGGGANIYSVRRDELVASLIIESQDISLALMIDPQADHSFVYYAASIDFVGDYLQSIHSNDESFFAFIALADNTLIRWAPSKTVSVGNLVVSDGEEHTMTLNLGDTLRVSCNEDLTGSRVTANKAISFYSGHNCASGRTTNCSALTEQIPPYNSWGNTFILHTNVSGLRGNMFKIIASDVGANVMMNCTTDGTNYEVNNFNLGFRQHNVTLVNHDYCIVNSDEDVLVIQFTDSSQMLQDTFMTILPALNHFQTKYVFPTYFRYDNYVILSVKNTDPNNNSLLLNETPLVVEWTSVEINGNKYYYSTLLLSVDSRQTLEFSRNDIKFGAILYGVSQRENDINTFALPAGLTLDINETLPNQGTYLNTHNEPL